MDNNYKNWHAFFFFFFFEDSSVYKGYQIVVLKAAELALFVNITS